MKESSNEKKEIRFIELFCGVGGFRLGLESANDSKASRNESRLQQGSKGSSNIKPSILGTQQFTCIWANDNDKYACQIYRERFGEKELIEGDIRNIPAEQIPEFELLTAGFPCQAFSIAGRREGFKDKTRGTLFYDICRIVRSKKPKYILLENVKGLLSHDSGRTFSIILLSLDELGYDVEWQMLNTKYWLPQNRERIFIFAVRRKS